MDVISRTQPLRRLSSYSVFLAFFILHSNDLHFHRSSFSLVSAQIIDNNSTNFHNMLWNAKYNLNHYHTYIFDYWKNFDVEVFLKNLQDPGYNTSWTDEQVLENLQHDDENETLIAKITSLCGRLRNASSVFISDDCFKDLDYVACALFDFVRDAKKFLKGHCDRLDTLDAQRCKERLKNKLLNNMWPIYMLDSFGKLPAGLNMGTHMTLGRFSDCNAIFVPRETHNGRPFETRYCRATFRLPLPETTARIARQCMGVENLINGVNKTCEPSENFARMKWGICAPKSCNTRNMTVLFRYIMAPTKNFCNVTVVCHSDHEYSTDTKFIIAISLIGIVCLMVLLATVYDMAFFQPALEPLADKTYEVVKGNEDAQDTEPNGSNGIVLYNGKTKQEYFEEQPTVCKMFLALSAYTNSQKIFNVDHKPDELKTIRAICAISSIWLSCILANIFVLSYIDNTKIVPKFIASFWFQLINNGSVVSDSFLLISGFLTALTFFKSAQNSDNRTSPTCHLIFRFFHGFLRIYVPYLFALIILMFIWKYAIVGPMWTAYFFNPCSPLQCIESFWTNLVFLNNFLHTSSPCMPVFQMLALVIQLKLLSAPLFCAFNKSTKIGLIVSAVLIALSCILQISLTFIYELPPSLMASANAYSMDKPLSRYYNVLFIKPYARWNSFIVGIILAKLLVKKPTKLSKFLSRFQKSIWFLCIAACAVIVFGLQGYAKNNHISPVATGFYAAFGRLAWPLAVATMIFMCETDMGGMVQWLLSQPFWAPLGRLTYSAYIVAPYVVIYTYATSESTIHMTSYNMLYFSIGCTVLTYICAFLFHLLFEAPVLSLRRIMYDPSVNRSDQSTHTATGGKTCRPTSQAAEHVHKRQTGLITAADQRTDTEYGVLLEEINSFRGKETAN